MVKRFQKKIGIPSKNNDEKEKFLRHKQTQTKRKGKKSGHFIFKIGNNYVIDRCFFYIVCIIKNI